MSQFDENVLEKYVGDEPITAADLRRAVRNATVAGEIVPVLCGTTFKNKGVQPLLDAVVDYLPSPVDVPTITGILPGKDEEETVHATSEDDAPFAHATRSRS